jgi:hypothetical protein
MQAIMRLSQTFSNTLSVRPAEAGWKVPWTRTSQLMEGINTASHRKQMDLLIAGPLSK